MALCHRVQENSFVKPVAVPFAALLVVAACSVAGPVPTVQMDMDQDFSLRPGEAAQSLDGQWRVGFDSVLTDSRCPKSERCVWAGDATARVWFQRGAAAPQVRDLHTGMGQPKAASALDGELRLVRLDPYPVSGKPIEKSAYVVTLVLSRSGTGESTK